MEKISETKTSLSFDDYGSSIHISIVAEMMGVSVETVRKNTWTNRSKRPYEQGNEFFGIYGFKNKLRIKAASIRDYYQIHHDRMRDFVKDKGLIREMEKNLQDLDEYNLKRNLSPPIAENETMEKFHKLEKKLCLMGINSLGPLHQNRESIIEILKRKGIVQILFLNPKSEAFRKRVVFEEKHNEKICGRLRAEYDASIAICRDIKNFSDNKGTFEVRVHSTYPTMSLVIIYPDSMEYGQLNQNVYPDVAGLRGLIGRTLPLKKCEEKDLDLFTEFLKKYTDLWKPAKIVNLR